MGKNNYIRELIRSVISEAFIEEGVYDKNIFKAFFLAGGPGSGKSFVVNQIFGTITDDGKPIVKSLSGLGFKIFNIDHAFEYELKKRNINMRNLAFLSKKEKEEELKARTIAHNTVDKMWEFYKQGRLGTVVDATSQNAMGVYDFKKELESIGYDTYMIYVSTDLEVALRRNKHRERVLPEDLVISIWEKANINKSYLKKIFDGNFIEVENNENKNVPQDIEKEIRHFSNKPIENPIALQWIKKEKELKDKLKIKQQHEL